MSEYAYDESSPQRHGGDINLPNSLDDSANNSIIGKVKSKVSSILPNRLTKWFSPSTNDSLNGSLRGESSSKATRRRRRIEVEEENYKAGDSQYCGQFKNTNLHLSTKQERDFDVDDENDNDDDDSHNSEYDYHYSSIKQTKSDLNVERQPPAKRSRLNIDARDSSYITRTQPLLSSTPDVSKARLSNSSTSSPTSHYNYQRYTHQTLYGKEPEFNFDQQSDNISVDKGNTNTKDMITNTGYEHDNLTESSNVYSCRNTGLSSLKSLNIPTSTALLGTDVFHSSAGNLKRQPLASAKADLSTIIANTVSPIRTSTTILEAEEQVDEQREKIHCEGIGKNDGAPNLNLNVYNGCIEVANSFSNKRQNLINGSSLRAIINPESNEVISLDSASESGESADDLVKLNSSHAQLRKARHFNNSANASTRNDSRTSSIGNGLNFYSHLEGRKSLFSGRNRGNSYPINNSTLSLTSLNRRQFNASIYGSTSALSDSRLMNTFSPFYKGKTTYGGASAYNKYTAGGSASTARIPPTLIRPTSSLSNISSCNSFASNANSQIGDNSAISSTAKRILDLINDFTTPLSDAKKMASNLKTNSISHMPPQAKTRLNEYDLIESRSIRLSQVRTPYSRSAVILQPSGNASGRGTACGIIPPIKELQVPTMSQLLQMKKMQSTTEKVRKITHNSGLNTVYTLPDVDISKTNTAKVLETDQQKHTNKVRNKITKTFRAAASKDLQDEEPPPPVNLPNIAFPIMQSVPKIDIQLNKKSDTCKTFSDIQSSKLAITTDNSNSEMKDSLAFNFSKNIPTEKTISTTDNTKKQFFSNQSNSTLKSFIFSDPLQVTGDVVSCRNINQNEKDKYKFSVPLDIISNCSEETKTQAHIPQLKKGSCLDALKKPFTLPLVTSECSLVEKTTLNKTSLTSSPGFGNQFKKSSNEWECDACLVRNMNDAIKCMACETPCKRKTSSSHSAFNSSLPTTSSFDQQFKKPSNEWECETCMVRNKEDITKCIACETPKKCIPPVAATIPPNKNSFGDAFKPKSGTWECQTCMISNKNEMNACVACQTKNPASTHTSQFKFGFTDANKTNTIADAGFKTLAAQQKVSKWECDACMTRNDANRTKCACCEQPKPGISNAELATTNSTKFEFGATAASKFSFGFGSGPNASKEEDIRKELSSNLEGLPTPKPTSTIFGSSPPNDGFKFGIKPMTNTDIYKSDVTDSNKQVAGFQFGSSALLKVNEKTTVVATSTSLESGSKLLTSSVSATSVSSPIKSSAAIVNTPSVKFSLPSTTSTTNVTDKDMTKDVALPVFGSASSAGFSFGSKIQTNTATTVKDKEKSFDNTAFKEPETKSLAFAFGSSAAKTPAVSTAPFVSSALSTTATTPIKTSTTTAVNTAFSFGANTSNVSAINSQSSPVLSSFVFDSNLTNNVAVARTTTTAVASTVSNTSNTTATKTLLPTLSTATTAPASTNIFGSFGSRLASNITTLPNIGFSINSPANNNLSSVSSLTNNTTTPTSSQFDTFGAKNSTGLFGSFGGVNAGTKNTALENEKDRKFTALPFGNFAPPSTSKPSQSDVKSLFMFGSKSVNNTTVVTTTSTAGSVTTTSTTWPKSSFVFGSNVTSQTITAPQFNDNESKEVAKTSVIRAFGPCITNSSSQQQKSSIFGVPTSNIGVTLSSAGTSSTGPTSFSTNLFNTNSAPAATNIFGANPSGNAATPTPSFGSSPFGGTASSTSATPTFGSTAATGTTFGSFGGSTSSTTSTEVKKPEAAFSFGAAPSTQSTSGGFNFGLSASTTKPAFNFGGASTTHQPTFNFSGSTETQSSTKPFQFGAIPSAPPVFNFDRSVLEGTPSAPFQFNAGAAPVSSNIFAPTPTAGAPPAQQAKRKIRAPIRRVTQR